MDKQLENTNVEVVLNIALKKIDRQDEARQSIETKAGIVMAFWGIVIGAILQSDIVINFIKIISVGSAKDAFWLLGLCWLLTLAAVIFFFNINFFI